MDDAEFHDRQHPFSLGQQRAIVAALNTLVFRTQLPEGGAGATGARAGGAGGKTLGRDFRILQAAAPLLHRWDEVALGGVPGATACLHCCMRPQPA